MPRRIVLALALLGVAAAGAGQDRVPRPEFDSGYQFPGIRNPAPRAEWLEYADVAVLALALGAAAWFGLKLRSRLALAGLSLFSIGYFGFFRQGCVCPVGSLQNVAYALFDPAAFLPLSIILTFLLPLLSTLAFGRSFCSSVCPLGAIQDLVVLKPLAVPRPLAAALGQIPVVYLGLAVLFAATGSDFIICRFDPFVSIYRLGGSFEILLLGAAFLAVGAVVARPYCRFFCPYGVILKVLSAISWKHVTITPDSCVRCRLCESACPIDAIEPPAGEERAGAAVAARGGTGGDRAAAAGRSERRRLAALLLAAPALVAAAGLLAPQVAGALALVHRDVRLARQVLAEDAAQGVAATVDSEAFRASTRTREELLQTASAVVERMRRGAAALGVFLAAAFVLAGLATFRRRTASDYTIDAGACVSCGRCFSYCPREHLRRRGRPAGRPAAQPGASAGSSAGRESAA